MTRLEILEQKMKELRDKRGVKFVSQFDPELGYITDAEEIRIMCLYENRGKYDLDLIHPMLEYCGLYPETMKVFNIEPEIEMMKKIYEQRKLERGAMNILKNSTYGAFGKQE